MCHDPMMKADFQDTAVGDPGLFAPASVAHAPGDRFRSCAKALGAALAILLLAGCELPSSFEELTKVFDGETQDAQAETGQEGAEGSPDGVDAAGAQDTPSVSDEGDVGRPSRETVLTVQTVLAGLGYEQYEVSAYARSGRRCRHNLNYWSFGDYLAVGAGAHGKMSVAGEVWRYAKPANPLGTATSAE